MPLRLDFFTNACQTGFMFLKTKLALLVNCQKEIKCANGCQYGKREVALVIDKTTNQKM